MSRGWPRIALLVGVASCASGGPGRLVTAPSEPSSAPGNSLGASGGNPGSLSACASPWTLGGIAGDAGSVVVVCKGDVRRELLSSSEALSRAMEPSLEPARERVCACAARLPVPAFIDLEFTTMPDQGTVSVQGVEAPDEIDSQVGTPFVACVGVVVAKFPPTPLPELCPGERKPTVKYPIRVDLTP